MEIRRQYHPSRPTIGSVISVNAFPPASYSPQQEEERWTVAAVKEKMVGSKIVTRMVLEQIVDQSPAETETALAGVGT